MRRARHGYYAAVSYARRAHRRGARGARGVRASPTTPRRLHGRPRRAAGRARALVQDVVPRGLRARAADRARAGPRRPARVAAPVSQLDLAPTLAELAGRTRPTARSSRARASPPLLPASGRAAGEAVGEYLAEGVDGAGGDDPARAAQVHPLRAAIPTCSTTSTADPHELRNLAGDPAAADLVAALPGRERRALGPRRARAAGAREPARRRASWAGRWPRRVLPLGLPAADRRDPPVRARRRGRPAPARRAAPRRRAPRRIVYARRIASATSGTSVTTCADTRRSPSPTRAAGAC